jgi:ribonuclease T1
VGPTFRKLALAVTVFADLAAWGPAQARNAVADLASVDLSSLPAEAQQTQQRIVAGGPFPYAKDGAVFGNRERRLPAQQRGYYREYTVKTPGSQDRGARRIVCGGTRPTAPQACFYSADHYTSFRLIVQ